MPDKKKTSKKRNTTFCQNKPSKSVKTVAVYMKEDGVWVICKGKLYKNYLLKYFYNGKSAIINDGSYRYWGDGYDDKQMQEIVTSMNLENLEVKRMAADNAKRVAEREAARIARGTDIQNDNRNEWIRGPIDDWPDFLDTVVHFGPAGNNHTGITEILNGNTND